MLILFNPMIMNVYSFSSYEDFHVAYVLLVIFYYNYENNFDLIKILEKKIIYILLYLYCQFQNLQVLFMLEQYFYQT